MNKTKPWNTLLKLAEIKSKKKQDTLIKARKDSIKIKEKLNHLLFLKNEYQQRLSSVQMGIHSIDKNLLFRKFISQLSMLEERLDFELSKSKLNIKKIKEQFKKAEKNRMKFDFLLGEETKKEKIYKKKLDIRRSDELSLVIYNKKKNNR